MKTISDKYIFFIVLVLCLIITATTILSSNATYDYGDGIQHYLIAKFSWNHPELLLDLWGKPIFTLLSSPFAQFGLKGMVVFQLLCTVASSIFAFLILKKFNLSYAWAVPVFIFFSPICFAVINSGLTEILLGLFLILCLWLLLQEHYAIACIVFSFAPFVRPESYLIFPLLISYLLIKKKFIHIPLLLTGILIFTIIGYFHFKDILWIIHNNYGIEQNYPQKGKLLHYVLNYKMIWGRTHAYIFLIGTILISYNFIKSIFQSTIHLNYNLENFFIILLPIIFIFILHTLMNWLPGLNNNLGMLRYLSSIIPLSSIVSIHSFLLLQKIPIKNYIKNIFVLIIAFIIGQQPFSTGFSSFQLSNEQIVINEASDFLLKNFNLNNKHICYLHPHITTQLNLDPFDNSKVTLIWSLDKNHLSELHDSTFILWDSHFSPQEGRLPLSALISNKNFSVLQHYQYFDDNAPFDLWIFVKTNSTVDTSSIPTTFVTNMGSLNNFDKINIYHNFNEPDSLNPQINNGVLKFLSNNEWGPVFSKDINEILNLSSIHVQFKFYPKDLLKEVLIIVHIVDESTNETIEWTSRKIASQQLNQWQSFDSKFTITNKLPPSSNIKIYFWNKSKNNFFIDDLSITYYYKN